MNSPATIVPRFLCVAAALFLFATPAFALPSYLTVSQLYHTQWTALDGAPVGVESLAQTSDGFLWMATSAGLVRFDGVKFERIDQVAGTPLLSSNVFNIWAPPDGGLWVGYRFGGVSFMKDGRITHYSRSEGLPSSTAMGFARDQSGVTWMATTAGLWRLVDGAWSQIGPEWNIESGTVVSPRVDRDGVLWVRGPKAVSYLRPGAKRFEPSGIALESSNGSAPVLSPDGRAWLVDAGTDSIWTLRAGETPVSRALKSGMNLEKLDYYPANITLIDRNDKLWIGSPSGVRRLSLETDLSPRGREPRSKEELVTLSGELVGATLQDREGNVWFSTERGLDRFRAPKLANLGPKAADEGFFSLAAASGGGVWVGSQTGDLYRYSGDEFEYGSVPTRTKRFSSLPNSFMECIYRDPHGHLWAGMRNEIWRLDEPSGKWTVWRRPNVAGGELPAGQIQALAMDDAGAMWASVVRVGVFRVIDDNWTPWGETADLPREPATVLTADPHGPVWFGYVESRVARLDHGQVRTYSVSDGLDVGTVLAITVSGQHAWVGGERGVARYDGSAFRTLKWQPGSAPATVTGIVETMEGDLWLNTNDGAVHIPAAQVDKARLDPSHAVQYSLLDHRDGMPGSPLALRPLPSIVVSDRGRLWFATRNGVAWIDPRQSVQNDLAPTVLIKSLLADGQLNEASLAEPGRISLPARTRNLQISYTATSLTIPERVQFRYQLEGRDSTWQEVETRREAFFTDLSPGAYRFHVIASNNDGVWNETGAAVQFVIPPTFLQSRWFLALCVAVGLCLVWALFQIRLKQANMQLRWRLEERMVERERIARELHDTFLQSVQGLMLQFQNVAEQIPGQESARQLMERALDRADLVLANGRDTVTSLRASTPTATDLPHAVRLLGDSLAQDHGVRFELSIEGAPRPLKPLVREEAYRITAQALTNAYQHAQATRVEAHISYGGRALVVRVSDNGKGFDPSPSNVPQGHWGLTGMRERAARINAGCKVLSNLGAGTSVELRVPGRMAYKRSDTAETGMLKSLWHRAPRDE